MDLGALRESMHNPGILRTHVEIFLWAQWFEKLMTCMATLCSSAYALHGSFHVPKSSISKPFQTLEQHVRFHIYLGICHGWLNDRIVRQVPKHVTHNDSDMFKLPPRLASWRYMTRKRSKYFSNAFRCASYAASEFISTHQRHQDTAYKDLPLLGYHVIKGHVFKKKFITKQTHRITPARSCCRAWQHCRIPFPAHLETVHM